jgi:HipA-like C-terminal domain
LFTVFEVPTGAEDTEEQLGARDKFWFERDESRWLFKEVRANSGEDWAEVLAARVAAELNLPHATYEFARHSGRRGVVTPKFHSDDFELVLGNELLHKADPAYPLPSLEERSRFVRVQQHTVWSVANVIAVPDVQLPPGWTPPTATMTAREVFGGFLLFDALIANSDRHHQNWGFLVHTHDRTKHLAPTFDHSVSLGSHEVDEVRRGRLETTDQGYTVGRYVRRNVVRSPFFSDQHPGKRLSMLEAWLAWDGSQDYWLGRLQSLDEARITSLCNDLHGPGVTGPAAAFAAAILRENRVRILEGG